MTHETEIVEYKKLSSGQFAVLIRCCGDEQHQHWHTVDSAIFFDEAKLDASLDEVSNIVAAEHEGALQVDAHLAARKGQKKELADTEVVAKMVANAVIVEQVK